MERGRWPIRGQLVRWAREQQGLSRAIVFKRGGPTIYHLTAVELGRKCSVSERMGMAIVRVLKVTAEFVRGEVPAWADNPAVVAGMAKVVVSRVANEPARWTEIGAMERVRTILTMILAECPHLPRPVLAHVLGVTLPTLDEMLLDKHPIMQGHMEAVSCLTRLPQGFFWHGRVVPQDGASPVSFERKPTDNSTV